MALISLSTQTMFADLLQRCLDAEFDEEFHSSGIFKRRKRGGKFYWYYKPPGRDAKERYVGPVTDKSIADRVERFSDIKSDYRDRQRMVRALTAAGLVPPDSLTGRLVEAMWQAGFFRLRGVLVGTVAFQAYAGLIGIDVRGRAMQTQDADFAQIHGVVDLGPGEFFVAIFGFSSRFHRKEGKDFDFFDYQNQIRSTREVTTTRTAATSAGFRKTGTPSRNG